MRPSFQKSLAIPLRKQEHFWPKGKSAYFLNNEKIDSQLLHRGKVYNLANLENITRNQVNLWLVVKFFNGTKRTTKRVAFIKKIG